MRETVKMAKQLGVTHKDVNFLKELLKKHSTTISSIHQKHDAWIQTAGIDKKTALTKLDSDSLYRLTRLGLLANDSYNNNGKKYYLPEGKNLDVLKFVAHWEAEFGKKIKNPPSENTYD